MIRNFLQACDYNNGYKKALIDVINWFDKHSDAMRYNHFYNRKGIHFILSALLEYSDVFQDFGDCTELTIHKEPNGELKIIKAEGII